MSLITMCAMVQSGSGGTKGVRARACLTAAWAAGVVAVLEAQVPIAGNWDSALAAPDHRLAGDAKVVVLGPQVGRPCVAPHIHPLRYRMECHFSPWTLYKPYLPLTFMMRQSEQIRKNCSQAVLEADVQRYRKDHPGCDESDEIRHLLKHVVPNSLPGSPAWHHKSLQDLLYLVEALGMPQLFLTLTADEVSETRWDCINDLEARLQSFCRGFTFTVLNNITSLSFVCLTLPHFSQDAPVECATVFHERVKRFMHEFIHVNEGKVRGIFGRVTDYVIRYEVQGRG